MSNLSSNPLLTSIETLTRKLPIVGILGVFLLGYNTWEALQSAVPSAGTAQVLLNREEALHELAIPLTFIYMSFSLYLLYRRTAKDMVGAKLKTFAAALVCLVISLFAGNFSAQRLNSTLEAYKSASLRSAGLPMCGEVVVATAYIKKGGRRVYKDESILVYQKNCSVVALDLRNSGRVQILALKSSLKKLNSDHLGSVNNSNFQLCSAGRSFKIPNMENESLNNEIFLESGTFSKNCTRDKADSFTSG